MARATAQSKRPNKPEARQTRNLPNVVRGWRFTSPALVLPLLFCALQWLLPLSTAVEIGADEGMELGKTTLWVEGHKLYTEVWNDQPPLHTFLTSQIYKHISHSVLGPRLLTMGFTALLLGSLFTICWRLNGVWVAGVSADNVTRFPGTKLILHAGNSGVGDGGGWFGGVAGWDALHYVPKFSSFVAFVSFCEDFGCSGTPPYRDHSRRSVCRGGPDEIGSGDSAFSGRVDFVGSITRRELSNQTLHLFFCRSGICLCCQPDRD